MGASTTTPPPTKGRCALAHCLIVKKRLQKCPFATSRVLKKAALGLFRHPARSILALVSDEGRIRSSRL
jgi:hypothetical protein